MVERRDETAALVATAGEHASTAAGWVQEMHRGVARRVFGLTPGSGPVRAVHDAISDAVYAVVGSATSAVGQAGARLAAAAGDVRARRGGPAADRQLTSRARGTMAVAALNALVGDRLDRQGSALALPTELRREDRPIGPGDAGAALRPDEDLVVWLHGLGESEHAWGRTQDGRLGVHAARLDAAGLRARHSFALYDTGRRISRSGRQVADLLAEVVAAAPDGAPRRLVLVGHSMGGLVARAALLLAAEDDAAWLAHDPVLVCLGAPHLGAPLEKGVNVASWALRKLPETAAVASFLDTRSLGIKDLRHGAVVDDDWRGSDPDELLRDRPMTDGPLPAEATTHVVTGAVGRSPGVGWLLGDLLVREGSGSGRGRRRRLDDLPSHLHLPGHTHFDLLSSPEVSEALIGWLVEG